MLFSIACLLHRRKNREDQQVGVTAGYLDFGSIGKSCLLLHFQPVAAQIESEVRILTVKSLAGVKSDSLLHTVLL